MTDLYLIAHKVRGEPAFDVAHQMPCPECSPDGPEPTCSECDGLGYWWIVSTSGHRAYPWWHEALSNLRRDDGYDYYELSAGEMPENWPDHYTTRAEPQRSLIDMLGILNAPLARKAPPIKRRF